MRIGPKIIAWGGLAAFLGIIVVFALPSYRHGEASVAGKRAEDFPMELDGKPVHFSNLRGKVVVLNFWGTWCPPCVEETPSLVQMQQRLKDKGVVVLAVSTDADDAAYHRFIKQHNVDLVTVRDANQQSNALYGTVMFPETWIIDRTGMVRRKFVGAVDWNTPEITEFLTRL